MRSSSTKRFRSMKPEEWWRSESFDAARGRGIKVRASVTRAGCLLRAVWESTGTHVDSWFLPRCYFDECDYSNLLVFGDNMLRKPVVGDGGVDASGSFEDETFATSYPTLFAFLADLSYEDGTARRTATLTMFVDEGQLKGSLNDRDNERTLFLSARSLMELLESFEAALSDARTAWRAYKPGFQTGQQKKGKKT